MAGSSLLNRAAPLLLVLLACAAGTARAASELALALAAKPDAARGEQGARHIRRGGAARVVADDQSLIRRAEDRFAGEHEGGHPHRMHLHGSRLAQRRAAMIARGDKAWTPTEQRKRKITTALKAYAALTTSAAKGAVRVVE